MIDLSKFVDKRVIITLRCGDVYETLLLEDPDTTAPYWFVNKHNTNQHYWVNGKYWYQEKGYPSESDIVDIQLKQQKTMALSDKTIERLAEALAPEAVEYIQQSDEYLQFMTEQLTKFLKERMGEMDNEVAVEIIGIIFADNMNLYARKPVL